MLIRASISSLLLSSLLFAQPPLQSTGGNGGEPANQPRPTRVTENTTETTTNNRVKKIKKGAKVTGANGTVTNAASTGASTGGVIVQADAPLKPDGNGNYSTMGNITTVTNPKSRGSDGPINVDVKPGSPGVTVNLNKSGPVANSQPIQTNVTGGGTSQTPTTVNAGPVNNVNATNGSNYILNLNGNGSTGNGGNSSGIANLNGLGNSFGPSAQGWTVRN